ncbi:hypothetical protein EO238_35415, partial [Citrobacter sp. AAK_AS5]
RELVGDDNFFLFGMSEPEVAALGEQGYVPRSFYEGNEDLRRAIDLIASGALTDRDGSKAWTVVGDLLNNDRFMVLA